MKRFYIFLMTLMFLAVSGRTEATPILLAEMPVSNVGSGYPFYETPTKAIFLLGYGFHSFAGGTKALGLDMDLLLGPEKQWSLGETGSYDFNATNAADFSGIAAMMTNGADDDISTGELMLLPGTALGFTGSLGIGPESGRLGSPDLVGASVDFIRLVATNVSFELSDVFLTRRLEANWQVWGTRAAVPEPSTLLLLGSGLAGVIALRKRLR
jgi:hypothetical protein